MTDTYWQSDPAGELSIPVARPRLPSTEEIAPYLRRIDQSRWYTNGGPLVRELEEKLSAHVDPGTAKVATVANATLGLTLALMAHDLPLGSLCMVPAWTFAATAHAIELAGLIPWIVDVSESAWALEPEIASELLGEAPAEVSAVMPVSPFGAPIKIGLWKEFRERTGVVVVIDAAAAFDSLHASEVPAVVSLHATKVLGVGEGGFVVSNDASFIDEIQKRANFGFWYSREATAESFNAKMSEYAAAVGLAALDHWTTTRADFARVASAYLSGFSNQTDVTLQEKFGRSWVASTVVISARIGAETAMCALNANSIGSRRWWGGGLHRHRAFANFPRHHTKNTDALVEMAIGLPCWRDLPMVEITRICELVLSMGK
jgi:dTDP-4-amino-4,6-dideoxygalactose transaminase